MKSFYCPICAHGRRPERDCSPTRSHKCRKNLNDSNSFSCISIFLHDLNSERHWNLLDVAHIFARRRGAAETKIWDSSLNAVHDTFDLLVTWLQSRQPTFDVYFENGFVIAGERRKLIIYWYAKGFGIIFSIFQRGNLIVWGGYVNEVLPHLFLWTFRHIWTPPTESYRNWPAQFKFSRYAIFKMGNSRALNIFALFLRFFVNRTNGDSFINGRQSRGKA